MASDERYTVAIVSIRGRFTSEFHCMSWQQAVALARQAKREFPARHVFLSDGVHVWRIEELCDSQ